MGGRKYNEKTANELLEVVEALIYYKNNAIVVPDKKTAARLEATTPEIRQKLSNFGLIEVPPTHTLKELWDSFLKTKNKMKDSTIAAYELVKGRFFRYFKENESLEDLTKERMIQ